MSSSLTDEEIARRLPPGQHAAKEKFPVLDLGIRPEIPEEDWRLRIGGLVENAVSLSLKEIRELPHEDATTDFHCVTTWSVLDAAWGGVPFSAILDLVKPHAEAHFVFLTSYDGYTTNVPVEALHGTGVLLADRLEGQPLPVRHGGPVRVVIPQLYGWKSAKFIKTIEFRAEDEPGYWEKRGYSDTADPWKEERFREA
ncbi:MAG: sulfite oxidase-like oxidoreductase [Verrucomicrobiae bacterium]|nr:sulfite oxidase-like oxidoreductase [Verrucomicrobiae bacterium]